MKRKKENEDRVWYHTITTTRYQPHFTMRWTWNLCLCRQSFRNSGFKATTPEIPQRRPKTLPRYSESTKISTVWPLTPWISDPPQYVKLFLTPTLGISALVETLLFQLSNKFSLSGLRKQTLRTKVFEFRRSNAIICMVTRRRWSGAQCWDRSACGHSINPATWMLSRAFVLYLGDGKALKYGLIPSTITTWNKAGQLQVTWKCTKEKGQSSWSRNIMSHNTR